MPAGRRAPAGDYSIFNKVVAEKAALGSADVPVGYLRIHVGNTTADEDVGAPGTRSSKGYSFI